MKDKTAKRGKLKNSLYTITAVEGKIYTSGQNFRVTLNFYFERPTI